MCAYGFSKGHQGLVFKKWLSTVIKTIWFKSWVHPLTMWFRQFLKLFWSPVSSSVGGDNAYMRSTLKKWHRQYKVMHLSADTQVAFQPC